MELVFKHCHLLERSCIVHVDLPISSFALYFLTMNSFKDNFIFCLGKGLRDIHREQ